MKNNDQEEEEETMEIDRKIEGTNPPSVAKNPEPKFFQEVPQQAPRRILSDLHKDMDKEPWEGIRKRRNENNGCHQSRLT